MFGRETRMLLRHYLGQGTTKSALVRQLGVSRDTIHRWIRDGDLDRDLDATPVRYGVRACCCPIRAYFCVGLRPRRLLRQPATGRAARVRPANEPPAMRTLHQAVPQAALGRGEVARRHWSGELLRDPHPVASVEARRIAEGTTASARMP
jgi:transposase-like protein